MKLKFRKYTKEQLIDAVANSTSIRQVLLILKVSPYGGNYQIINNYIKELNLDISHFTGQAWSKNKKLKPKSTLQDYLSNKVKVRSSYLRERLIQENIFEHKCSNCNNSEWLNQPIPLELDHIDGNHNNNNLNNLRLLCPNCHAFTSTYRRRKDSIT